MQFEGLVSEEVRFAQPIADSVNALLHSMVSVRPDLAGGSNALLIVVVQNLEHIDYAVIPSASSVAVVMVEALEVELAGHLHVAC